MFSKRRFMALALGLAVSGSVYAQTATPPAPAQASAPAAQTRFITVSSTTSTTDSGLFNHLLPAFRARSGIEVRWSARAPGRRSIPAGAATRTWCSCMPARRS